MDTAASPAFAVRLEAADGYPLQATCHAPTVEPAGRLIVAGATGVAQRFYGRFAAFAAAQGVETWTLDYRGIGQSRPPSLRGFRMDYLDWARLDLAALVDHVAARGRGPLWMVAHSFGGQAFGLLPGTERVQRLVTFGTGAGWHGWMPPLERLRVLFLWNVAGPALVRARGYLAWSLLGQGEDLPRDLYLQWRRWCRWPRYFFDDPDLPGLEALFARVRTPIVAVNALDDRWALPASRDAFMSAYRGAVVERVDLDPRSLGLRAIGHFSYFRPEAIELWRATLACLRDGSPWPIGVNPRGRAQALR